MTAGACILILCSIVILSITGIQIYRQVSTLKEKRMKVGLLLSYGTVLTLTIGMLTLISVYRDKKEQSAPPTVEKLIHTAVVQNALKQTEKAISTLDAAERDYPEAWSEAMEDSDLAVQVQSVRDTWDEMNGGQ